MNTSEIVLVLGQLESEEQKPIFIRDIVSDITGIPDFDAADLNTLLSDPPTSEISRKNGCAVLLFNFEGVKITVMQRPDIETILDIMKECITSLPNHINLLYSGLICEATGAWILPTGIFRPNLLEDLIASIASRISPNLADSCRPGAPISLHIGCAGLPSGGEWRQLVASAGLSSLAGRPLVVSVNRLRPPSTAGKPAAGDTPAQAPPAPEVEKFCKLLVEGLPDPLCLPIELGSNKQSGSSILVNHPCLYLFSGCSSQSAIFTIQNYALMVNTGCSRSPDSWKIAQHLDNIDAILQTHWSVDNLFGLSSILPLLTKSASDLQRSVCLITPPPALSISQKSNGKEEAQPTDVSLTVNVVSRMSSLFKELRTSGTLANLHPMEAMRSTKLNVAPKCIQLFHKIGYGSLDLYPLTPSQEDDGELRRLSEAWLKGTLGTMSTISKPTGSDISSGKAMPRTQKPLTSLISQLSVSALVIWTPARRTDAVLRLLFVSPNAHQLRVLTALDCLSSLMANLCQPTCHVEAGHPKKPQADSPAHRPTALTSTMKSRQVSAPKNTSKLNVGPVSNESTNGQKSMPTRRIICPPLNQKHIPFEPLNLPPVKQAKPTEAKNASASEKITPSHSTHLPKKQHTKPISNSVPPSQEESAASKAVTIDEVKEVTSISSDIVEEKALTDPPRDTAEDCFKPSAEWGNPQNLPPPGASRLHKGAAGSGATKVPARAGAMTSSPGGSSQSAYDKLKVTFVDVAFLPGEGDLHMVDAEWFKHLRARYYVATTPVPSPRLLEAFVVGREGWTGDHKAVEASLILSHESKEILSWASVNAQRLSAAKADICAIIARSNIQVLQAGSDITAEQASANLTYPGFRLDL